MSRVVCLVLVACGARTAEGTVIIVDDASVETRFGCPVGLPGPPLVPISGSRLCIDSTEVTNAQFAQFLAVPQPQQTDACVVKRGHVPAALWPYASGRAGRPVVNVDWCDAEAYCAWAQKRLCGSIEGVSGDLAQAPTRASAWTVACGGNTATQYPYGNTYEPNTCNTRDSLLSDSAIVSTFKGCINDQAAFDLSGNVWEWEDACATVGGDRLCAVRGGSFRNDAFNDTCQGFYSAPFRTTYDYYGFRCCASQR